MKRRVLVLILLTTVGLVASPAASALIQVDRGIAGARIGNTKAQVRTALDRPGQRITAFFIRNGRVTSVTVGRVID